MDSIKTQLRKARNVTELNSILKLTSSYHNASDKTRRQWQRLIPAHQQRLSGGKKAA
jgi:glutamate-1-semialdehyde aminotransferase